MNLLGLLVALLLAPAPAAASFAICLVTNDRIVCASDSRTWDRATDSPGGDSARKVDVRGEYAFAMTGFPSIFGAWERTPPRAGESAADLARRVLAAVAPDTVRRQEFALVLARFGTPVDAVAIKAEITPAGRLVVLQQADGAMLTAPWVLGLGWDEAGADKDALIRRLQDGLRAAPDEGRMVAMAIDALQTAGAHSKKIGEPWHVASVDQTGAHWHTRESDLEWDGTNLVLVSSSVTIGSGGITMTPEATGVWDELNSYRWSVTGSARLGITGSQTASQTSLVLTNLAPSGDTGVIALQTAVVSGGSGTSLTMTGAAAGASTMDIDAPTLTLRATNFDINTLTGAAPAVTIDGTLAFTADATVPTGGIAQTTGDGLTLKAVSGSTRDFTVLSTGGAAVIGVTGAEIGFAGVSGDGTGKILCVKADASIGTCDAGTIGASSCTCS